MIPGGRTNLAGAEAAEDADDGAKGGVEAFAKFVLIGDGIASLFAYRLSSLDREGEGMGTLTDRLEQLEEESSDKWVNELSIVEYDIGVEDSCVAGVNAVFTVSRFAGENPGVSRGWII